MATASSSKGRTSCLLMILLFALSLIHEIKPNRRQLLEKSAPQTGEKCQWIAWKKKRECSKDETPQQKIVNDESKSQPSKPSTPKDAITMSRSQMKVVTNQRPKPVGHAWRIAVVYHGHYDRRYFRMG